jgi:hypothetical protein
VYSPEHRLTSGGQSAAPETFPATLDFQASSTVSSPEYELNGACHSAVPEALPGEVKVILDGQGKLFKPM